jgi:hypothetical protein
MKKALKEHFNWRISLLVLFISLLVSCSQDIETKIEENPAHIETIIGVELPELELINSERGVGSHYISYTYEFKFREPISEAHITNLEELCRSDKHWSKNFSGDYIYATNKNGDIMDCLISTERLIFGYSQSDGEEDIADFIIIVFSISAMTVIVAVAVRVLVLIYKAINKKAEPEQKEV